MIGVPSIAVITSPDLSPAAAAGPPARTVPMVAPLPDAESPTRDAEVGVLDDLAGDQVVGDGLDGVGRDGEADAGVGAAAVLAVDCDLHVRADDLAARVDQRAAGVAVVDRGIGLDRVRDRVAVRRLDVAVDGADDAGRDALGVAERAADRDDALTRRDRGAVGERRAA